LNCLSKKGKAVPSQAWSGPEGSRKLRFQDFMITAQDGGKVVSLTHRPPLPPGNTPGTHFCKSGFTLVTLPRTVTPYRDGVDGTRDRVTYQKLLTRSRYGLVLCAVGIWPSHQRDDTVKAGASVDVQRDT